MSKEIKSMLTKMPNIGSALEDKLIEVGIETQKELKKLGSKEAFMRIRSIDESSCYNMLCALEGAVQGIRWHYLSEERKKELKDFYKSIE